MFGLGQIIRMQNLLLETKNIDWDVIGLSKIKRTGEEVLTIKDWQHMS